MPNALLLVLALGVPGTLLGQVTPAQVRSLLGCYRVQLIGTERPGEARFFEWVPDSFRLDATVNPDSSYFRGSRVIALGKGGKRPPLQGHSGWTVTARDSVALDWGDGFWSSRLSFRIAKDTLRGTAVYDSDAPNNRHRASVKAWRKACGPSSPPAD